MNSKQLATHRQLRVWQASMDFVVDVYSITKNFPGEEKFGLISQMRRSAVSIPSNITEGSSRRSRKDYIRFLRIAHGSAAELDTQLDIANRLGYISSVVYLQHRDKLTSVLKMMSALIKTL